MKSLLIGALVWAQVSSATTLSLYKGVSVAGEGFSNPQIFLEVNDGAVEDLRLLVHGDGIANAWEIQIPEALRERLIAFIENSLVRGRTFAFPVVFTYAKPRGWYPGIAFAKGFEIAIDRNNHVTGIRLSAYDRNGREFWVPLEDYFGRGEMGRTRYASIAWNCGFGLGLAGLAGVGAAVYFLTR